MGHQQIMGQHFLSIVSVAIVILVVCSSSVNAKKIPDYITLCHQNDPQLNECVKRAIEQVRPHLAKGIPELLIPPVDPLVIPEASLDTGDAFRATFKDIKVYYGNEFIVESLNVDLVKARLDIALRFPRLRMNTDYHVKGKLLILELDGTGPSEGNFTNIVSRATVQGERYTKQGKEHFKFINNTFDIDLGKPSLRFDSIFRENQELNEQTNRVINENIVDVIAELRPVIDRTIIQVVVGIIERIFTRFSVDELFPK